MPEPLAETFTFASGEKRYVMFLRFDVRNYPRFLKYLMETLGVEMGSVKNMVFAKAPSLNSEALVTQQWPAIQTIVTSLLPMRPPGSPCSRRFLGPTIKASVIRKLISQTKPSVLAPRSLSPPHPHPVIPATTGASAGPGLLGLRAAALSG